jgi:hypothetical protein
VKSLPDALRALPLQAPAQSAWPQLAAQLAAQGMVRSPQSTGAMRATRRAWRVPAALAAGVLLVAIAWPLLRRDAPAPAPAVAAATVSPPAASMTTNAANDANTTSGQGAGADAAQLASLQERSQALEHWLRETQRAATPLSGQDLAASAEIEDMIALVDGQLGAAPRDSEMALWRRRVALLEDLTALRYSSYKLAEKTGVALR